MASLANSCHACGKSHAKLLLCGRCRNAWFCNRECQVVARKELGHRGVNCRPTDGAQKPASSANARAPFAAPSRPSTAIDVANLCQRFADLSTEANEATMANTRIGYLASAEKCKEAVLVADLIGGAKGAVRRADANQLLSNCLLRLGNMAAAAQAACSSLRAARASGRRQFLVIALITCGIVAKEAPGEMVKAERESREQERLSGSPPSHGGLDLSQEGRISLPTTPAALSRLDLAYREAALATCDAALAAVGGRDSPAAADERCVPSLELEARAGGSLGLGLHDMGEQQRGSELLRQAVALMRQVVPTAAPGLDALEAKRALAALLCDLGARLPDSNEMAEAAACMREALELLEETDDAKLKQTVLSHLANMSGRPDQPVGLAEAAAFRSQLNALYAQAGRNHDTSCTICLELLEQPDGGVEQDTTGDSGRMADGLHKLGRVRVGLRTSVPPGLSVYLVADGIE